MAATFAAALAFSPAAAQAGTVPGAIKVPAGNHLFLQSHAVGVQIYSCGSTGWTFVAPRATLYGPFGLLKIGTHFAGPTWKALDGSQFVGKAAANASVEETAIPWLLVAKVSSTRGAFGITSYIQRISTTGGLAPAAATCGAGTAGTRAEVPYTADYRFFTAL